MFFTVISIITSLLALLAALIWFLRLNSSHIKYLSAPVAAAAIIHLLPDTPQMVSVVLFVVSLAVIAWVDKEQFWLYLTENKTRPRHAPAPIAGVLGRYEFSYSDVEGNISRRRVDVHKIWKEGNKTYFSGFCHRADDERTFRLDRVFGDVIDLDTGEVVFI